MTQGDKLTTVTRTDISSGYKTPQSIHSVVQFSIEHSALYLEWNQKSNYLCCLETSLEKLYRLIDMLDLLKIRYSVFREPDIDMSIMKDNLTSITIEALDSKTHKSIFKKFKLVK